MARVPLHRIRNPKGQFVNKGVGVEWVGLDVLANNVNRRGNSLNASRKRAMERLAQEMENYAKANAPWQDRTGDARGGLKGTAIHNDRDDTSTAYLGHSVRYGVWLELNPNLAIILPTIEHFAPRVNGTVKEIWDRERVIGGLFT